MSTGFTKRDVVEKVLERDLKARPSRSGFGQWKSLVLDALLELQTESFKSKGYVLNPGVFRSNQKVIKDLRKFCYYTKKKYDLANHKIKTVLNEEFMDKPWNEYPIELFTQSNIDHHPLIKPKPIIIANGGFTKRKVVEKVLELNSQARPSQTGLELWKTLLLDALLELQIESFKRKGYTLDPDKFRTNSKVLKDINSFCYYSKRKYDQASHKLKTILGEEFLDKPWNEYHIGLFDPNKPIPKVQEPIVEIDNFTRRDVVDKVCKRDPSLKPTQPGFVRWKTLVLDALWELQSDIFKKQGHDLDSNMFRSNLIIQADCSTFRRAVNNIYIASNYNWESVLQDSYFDSPWRTYSKMLFGPKDSTADVKQLKLHKGISFGITKRHFSFVIINLINSFRQLFRKSV